MSDDSELKLPPIQQATLTSTQLDLLVSDITGLTEVLEVRLKGGAEAHSTETAPTFAEGIQSLREGALVGVQVRYRHSGQEWLDTLIRGPEGIRLVRMAALAMRPEAG